MDYQSEHRSKAPASISHGDPPRRWAMSSCDDSAFDDAGLNPDGTIRAVQYKFLHYPSGLRGGRAETPLEEACPHCTEQLWPGLDSNAACNLTVAASSAFFKGSPGGGASVQISIPPTATGWQTETIVQRLVPRHVATAERPSVTATEPGMPTMPIDIRDIVRLLKHWRHLGRGLIAAGCAVRAAYHAARWGSSVCGSAVGPS
jgi:hypothetical protein